MTRFILLIGLSLSLAACSTVRESRLNPTNWFGRAEQPTPVSDLPAPATDPRSLIGQVTSLKIAPTPEGVIVTAVGLPQTQGYWEADLVEIENINPAVRSYSFRVFPPRNPQPQGTTASRQIIVGKSLTRQDLRGVGTIVVVGAQNQLSARR